MMWFLNGLIIVEVAMLFLVAKGFWPMVAYVKGDNRLRNLGIAFQLLTLAVGLRVFWWDILPFLVDENALAWARTVTGHRAGANTLFALMTIGACLILLRTIWLLIPEDERHHWSIWTAPFYPKLRGYTFQIKSPK